MVHWNSGKAHPGKPSRRNEQAFRLSQNYHEVDEGEEFDFEIGAAAYDEREQVQCLLDFLM